MAWSTESRGRAGLSDAPDTARAPRRRYRDPDAMLRAGFHLALALVEAAAAVESAGREHSRSFDQHETDVADLFDSEL